MKSKRPKLHKGDIVLFCNKDKKRKWSLVVIIIKIYYHKVYKEWLLDTTFGIDNDGLFFNDLVKTNWIFANLKIKKLGHIEI